jgi:hypothetical protein
MPRPVDVVIDSSGRLRAVYEDGSLGPPLSLDSTSSPTCRKRHPFLGARPRLATAVDEIE